MRIGQNSSTELLPLEALPDEESAQQPFKVDKGKLYVRLDQLPPHYFPKEARYGGLGYSKEFMVPYRRLKRELQAAAENLGLDQSQELTKLLEDPGIIAGAQLSVFPEEQVWVQILHYGMKELGIWDESFDDPFYDSMDHLIEGFYFEFDYSLLIPVMMEFGGWIDFAPGIRGKNYNSKIACNFTTKTVNDNGLSAIVENIFEDNGRPFSEDQIEFIEDTFSAFGIQHNGQK